MSKYTVGKQRLSFPGVRLNGVTCSSALNPELWCPHKLVYLKIASQFYREPVEGAEANAESRHWANWKDQHAEKADVPLGKSLN